MLHTIYLLISRYYATTEWCGVYHGWHGAGAVPGWSRAGGELQSGTRGGDPANTGCRLGLVDTVDTPCRYYTALTMSPPAACVMCRYIYISMQSVALVQLSTLSTHCCCQCGECNEHRPGARLGRERMCRLWTGDGCRDTTQYTDTERWRRDLQLCFSRGFI